MIPSLQKCLLVVKWMCKMVAKMFVICLCSDRKAEALTKRRPTCRLNVLLTFTSWTSFRHTQDFLPKSKSSPKLSGIKARVKSNNMAQYQSQYDNQLQRARTATVPYGAEYIRQYHATMAKISNDPTYDGCTYLFMQYRVEKALFYFFGL